MKIGFDSVSAAEAEARPAHPVRRLTDLLARHAPAHECRFIDESSEPVEIYHSVGPVVRRPFDRRYAHRVITIDDLAFLLYPHTFGLFERIVVLPLYRYDCRRADRLIAPSRRLRELLAEELALDVRRIEVVPSVRLLREERQPDARRLASVREKYDLPERFVLVAGVPEPRFRQALVLRTLAEQGIDADLVLTGRRSEYSDELLAYVRARHLTPRVEFLYEPDPEDLPAIYASACGLVYLPRGEASQLPVVEALRAGLPMILSDTPLNRETAADAARYLHPESTGALAAALETLIGDEAFRSEYSRRARRRAERFSEASVAARLVRIYSSL